MRTDIEYDLVKRDVVIEKQNRYKTVDAEVVEVDNVESTYVYMQVSIGNKTYEEIAEDGLYVHISYTPEERPIKLIITRTNDDGDEEQVMDGADSDGYYTVQATLFNGSNSTEMNASELVLISDTFDYYLQFIGDGDVQIYAAAQSDFNMKASQWQDANFLLQCVPTNNYRYPVAGVGLINWVHSGSINGECVTRMNEEFTDDGMTIVNANYDFETDRFYLKLQNDE